MAIDTETKRRSALAGLIMALVIAPVPDGTIAAVDRGHIIGVYAGIPASAPGLLTSNINIISANTVEPNHASDSSSNLLIAGELEVQGTTYFTNLEVTDKIIVNKASGNGIKVDTATPTFGFADLLGDQFSKNTGASKPTLAAYNGAVEAWQFGNADEAFMTYHIPHDYVLGTDIHLHIHWSQNATGATGGTVDFRYTAIYAKGHNQAAGSVFTSTPITAIFSSIDIDDGGSGLNRYQQHFTEITISAASATSALFDRDDFEPDGVIELTFELVTSNLTGTPSTPFVHYVDIHYQTTSITGTKSRTPDFYA